MPAQTEVSALHHMNAAFFEFSCKKYAALGAICLGFSMLARWWFMGVPVWIFCAAAFWALVFLTPLAMDLVPRLVRHPQTMALEEFQGVHHEFGGQRVRVLYAEGLVWLATKDIYGALGLAWNRDELRRLAQDKRHGHIPGTQLIGIAEQHVADFVARSGAPEARRFNLWFQREVLFPIRTKVERGIAVAETVGE